METDSEDNSSENLIDIQQPNASLETNNYSSNNFISTDLSSQNEGKRCN